ncbi:FliM/FliN family flagellar motor switch protein [Pseudovibrio ascidiaceicola]|uniref:FliM/FliN family flagellar motor switch protein n=1 Tax=Pseudovibrio ascidiaceicola TaxID=285279 RepID=UPI000D68C536|nr:FliM/FliN family flagellar motor switch protein [Pseudovibrio ascidiaceicola]
MTSLNYQTKTDPLAYWNAALSYAEQDITVESTHTLNFQVSEAPSAFAQGCVLRSVSGATAVLVLEDFPFAAQLNVPLAYADVLELEDGLRNALVEGIVSNLRNELPADFTKIQSELPLQPVSALLPARELEQLKWFAVRYGEIGGAPVLAKVGVRPDALSSFLGDLPLTAQPAWRAVREQLNTSICLTLCEAPLPTAEVSSLRIGDLVVLDAPALGQRITVDGPLSRHHLVLVEQGWGCERIESVNGMSELTEEANAEQASGVEEIGSIDLSQMTVPVRFEVDEREISIAELESWAAGSLVNIDVPALNEETPVYVRAAGKRIAKGHLVQIDERVALRISKTDRGTGL